MTASINRTNGKVFLPCKDDGISGNRIGCARIGD
jgi:hypothetical protein